MAEMQTKELPDVTSTHAPDNTDAIALVANMIIKASAGNMYSVSGYNSSTAATFIQLHDSATIPADGAVPVYVFTVPGSSNFTYEPSIRFGRFFRNGIVVTNSSTVATKTVSGADCWYSAQYK